MDIREKNKTRAIRKKNFDFFFNSNFYFFLLQVSEHNMS